MVIAFAAAAIRVTPPGWSTALMFCAFAVWAAFFIADFFIHDLAVKRRAYWSGWLGGCTLAALALLDRGWSTAVAAFGAFALVGAIAAIRFTPYFKIGGRVIALHASDRREGRPAPTPTFPRPIRDTTGPHFWWLFVVLAAFASLCVVVGSYSWQTLAVGGPLVVVMAMFGIDDGRRRFPIVRRQYLQAVLLAAVCIPLYEVPLLVYVAAYAFGAWQPAHRSRHDAEARYHHHHHHQDLGGQRHGGAVAQATESGAGAEVIDYPETPND
ncbi:hypothetical protein MAHJHV61_00390 [Mycobacterium avium subsp. hominissuis]|uniref:Uncharacterized protein n=1 Tax=Mycobacterium kyorinense TaxID=487514 RepID=A0A1X1XY39_9MYCO|nr:MULTISPECIES: hypothetical protein [Mycobacterium]MBZ4632850.1 hypothetical protein [Mycobacterium avium subsp. hominissuis]ORW03716.1 hypothetical protein AWC14_00300 [Mycobacterium kyorinense]QWY65144.1 hypothetical protein BJP78_25790 [Mycobacterium avium subsp. hominissuis]